MATEGEGDPNVSGEVEMNRESQMTQENPVATEGEPREDREESP